MSISLSMSKQFTFYEFFCGGGMARAGLGKQWDCLFANDIDPKKGINYIANWGEEAIKIADINTLEAESLKAPADLAWASFPCQDLSLAGNGAGLNGNRSGTFWGFWNLIEKLSSKQKEPHTIVLENVCGAVTSNSGEDFQLICKAVHKLGYRFGAVIIDAVHFVPQSRPRLFIIAVKSNSSFLRKISLGSYDLKWHPEMLVNAFKSLEFEIQESWIWWNLRQPIFDRLNLLQIIEEHPVGVKWHTQEQTLEILSMMSPINQRKVEEVKKSEKKMVGTIYKRTRNEKGQKIQRAEVRFDNIAGCLRTPAGGSSRQIIILVNGNEVKTRLLSPREAARLMGLPDSYKLPSNYNEAYHLLGDGVVVPVVRHIASNILEPILSNIQDLKAVTI